MSATDTGTRRTTVRLGALVALVALALPGAGVATAASPTDAPASTGASTLAVPETETQGDAEPVSAVLANVGNVSLHCAQQAFNLCLRPVEERVAAGLAALDPDVVALLEVLPPRLCERQPVLNPFNVCWQSDQEPPQVSRLLAHDEYDVVCAERHGSACLAVRSSLGSIEGCPEGYCGPAAESVVVEEGCGSGFESFAAPVHLRGASVHVGVAHANAHDEDCRARDLTALFEDAEAQDDEALLLTDANVDPYRRSDASTAVWDRFVGEGRPFAPISGIAEHDPPHYTMFPLESAQLDPTGQLPVNVELRMLQPHGATIDHVLVSTGLGGECTTLDEAAGARRLEGPRGGLNHRALACAVTGIG